MISAEECLRYAEQCEQLARESQVDGDPNPMLIVAEQWRKLALPSEE